MNGCLIIASPRSGSTNLMRSIGSSYSIKTTFEPFAHGKNKTINPNTVTKVIASRLTILKVDQLISLFDKTILLTRKSILEASQSLYFLQHCIPNQGEINVKWSASGTVFDNNLMNRYIRSFSLEYDLIHSIGSKYNIPVDYYEDVYSSHSLSDSSISLDTEYLNPSKKLRNDRQITAI